MKTKLLSIISCSAAVALCASCTDDLDQFPHTDLTSADLYKNVEQYESVLAKIYASFSTCGNEKGASNDISSNNGQDFGRCLFNLQECTTDEVAATWLEGDKQIDLVYHQWDANDAWVSDVYYRCYYNIALCNEYLRYCTDGAIAGFSEADRATIASYREEARFLRAYYYYWVLDLFRKGPMVTEKDLVGSYVPDVADAQGLFDYVESELKSCAEGMTDRANSTYGRAPRAAAWAMLSRLYLNAKVYIGTERLDDCIEYSQRVIAEGYTLHDNYAQLFNGDNHKRTNEIILHAVVDGTTTMTWGTTTLLVQGAVPSDSQPEGYDPNNYGVPSGWGNMRTQSQTVDRYSATDARKLLFENKSKVVNDPTDQTQGYIVTKWTNLTDAGEAASNASADGVSTDMPMLRLAEVYLNLAEAVARGGSKASAAEATSLVNELRTRAGVSTIAEADLTTEFLFDERGREMLWEMTRRTDLIRYDRFTTADYLWDTKSGASEAKYNYFPIPQSELTANPKLSNPEY